MCGGVRQTASLVASFVLLVEAFGFRRDESSWESVVTDWKENDIVYVDQPELTMMERLYLPQVFGGMKTTLRHVFKKRLRAETVIQYPEEQRPLRKEIYRGVHRLNRTFIF